jgi:hypothetical protein
VGWACVLPRRFRRRFDEKRGRRMSRSNGNFVILDENHVLVISPCHLPSSVLCNFHYHTRCLASHCCALNFLQEGRVNTHYVGYESNGGHDRGGDQGAKGKEFHYRGGQATLSLILEHLPGSYCKEWLKIELFLEACG